MKILVVDDSALMRRALGEILSAIPGAQIQTARNGAEALAALPRFEPDVITLDVNMPVMDGLTCLSHIMTDRPRPVVMVSSITTEDSEATLEALAMGAVAIIEKPGGTVSKRLDAVGEEIRRTVKGVARARARGRAPAARPARSPSQVSLRPAAERARPAPLRGATPRPSSSRGDGRLVIIGVSTGGPAALEEVVPALPADFPCPVIVVQHMPASFTGSFAARLDACSALRVVEARDVSPLDAGTAYVVQGGGDAVLERRLGRLALRPVPPDPRHTWHPSVDRVVSSALDVAAPREMLGVLLTGMGDDGAEAMAALRARGGWTIAESEASAVVFGMPRELIERGGASEIDAIGGIATRIQRWARRPEVAPCP